MQKLNIYEEKQYVSTFSYIFIKKSGILQEIDHYLGDFYEIISYM